MKWLFSIKTLLGLFHFYLCLYIIWAKLTLFLKEKLKATLLAQCQFQNHTDFQVKNYQVCIMSKFLFCLIFAFLNKLWPRSNLERKYIPSCVPFTLSSYYGLVFLLFQRLYSSSFDVINGSAI